ncbi:hypothetical protein HMN09_00537500 [Mycena chlorophos]|uniref:Uncharacterized protein n=1 Tax=Mycena chlorophos TaxID=658473 RepID=A0A8H6WDG3_MYCCL|nr:hypothetical protein HMN09_00537500 [Mycena chlorophos]
MSSSRSSPALGSPSSSPSAKRKRMEEPSELPPLDDPTSTSRSEVSGLKKMKTTGAEPQDLVDELRNVVEQVIASLCEDLVDVLVDDRQPDWKALGRKALDRIVAQKLVNLHSVPFTSAHTIFDQFVDSPATFGTLRSCSNSRRQRPSLDSLKLEGVLTTVAAHLSDDGLYAEKVKVLRRGSSQQAARRHIVNGHETSSRVFIDNMVLEGAKTAQEIVNMHQDVDESLRLRHDLLPLKQPIEDSAAVSSWLVMRHHVNMPPQKVTPDGIHLHGICDYFLQWVSTAHVAQAIDQGALLRVNDISGLNEYPRSCATFGTEVKANERLNDKKMIPQAVSQGVAQLARSKRDSVVTTLTDGLRYQFFHVRRNTPQEVLSGGKHFSYECTRILQAEHDADGPVVLKLLVAAMIGDPKDFPALARIC